jgi:UDP:flavonoid glycosyltransferase YjiC (YdhE family)
VARIVLNTFGSFGDVHPYLALAIELQRRGHECVLATAEIYRQKVTAEGVGFADVRPNVGELLNEPELIQKLWHPRKGSVYLLRDYLLPKVEQSFTDLDRACYGADLLLTHAAGYAGPVVAAGRKIPWLSVALQPAVFFSVDDPPVIAAVPWARHLYPLGRWVFASMLALARIETRRWARPVLELRKRFGLETASNPVLEGQFSPLGTLTLFSQLFAQQQPDWPPNSSPTGFVFYDKRGEVFGLPAEPASGMSDALCRFLSNGPPPVLFTLGSSAVMHPGTFYSESAQAAKKLNVRAILLTGKQDRAAVNLSRDTLIHAEDYASYSALMPLVSAVVHQGGIGTVAQTLRAGKPMLVAPWAHDQPDNGYRLQRLGVARVLPRSQYTACTAAKELESLLTNSSYSTRAQTVARSLRNENGLSEACARIEDMVFRTQ